jgi:hypothetical protein
LLVRFTLLHLQTLLGQHPALHLFSQEQRDRGQFQETQQPSELFLPARLTYRLELDLQRAQRF